MNYLDIALEYHSAGFNVVPVSQTKQPMVASWKQWQDRQQTEEEVRQAFSKDSWGIALVCGWNDVEVIDVDVKNDPDGAVLEDLKAELKREPYKFIEDYAYQTTPTGGAHLIYRSYEKPPGNNGNLARKQGKAIIETRGSGGYALIAPSPGYKMWWKERLINSRLTQDEREGLMTLCKTFNEDHEGFKEAQPKRTSDELRPGDIYNRDTTRHEIIEMLEHHGWTVVRERGKQVHFCRPGKTEGISGNWHDDHHKFYCFTSSASPLQADTSYSPFALLVALEYGGDWTKAAKDIAPSEPASSSLATIEQRLEANKDKTEEEKWPGAFVYDPRTTVFEPEKFLIVYETTEKEYEFLPEGGILSAAGEKKARKSLFLRMLAAGGVNMQPYLGFRWIEQPKRILIFDTEQPKIWIERAGNYLTKLCGPEWPDIIEFHSVRGLPKLKKLDYIEEKMYLANNPELVIIDGIVDLSHNFNDLESSSMIIDRIMVNQGKSIVAGVIHLNKTSPDERGHMGALWTDKADTIIRLTLNEENLITTVKNYRSRGLPFPEFDFTQDSYGNIIMSGSSYINPKQYSNL